MFRDGTPNAIRRSDLSSRSVTASGKDRDCPVSPHDVEVSSVNCGDLVDTESFCAGDDRGIDRSKRKIPVTVDEIGDAQPIGGMDRLDVERPRRHVAEEPELGGRPETGAKQIHDFGDYEGRDNQRSRVSLKKIRARRVVLVIGVHVRVKGTRIDDERYEATSLRRISSILSDTSCRPLLPAARAPRTRRPGSAASGRSEQLGQIGRNYRGKAAPSVGQEHDLPGHRCLTGHLGQAFTFGKRHLSHADILAGHVERAGSRTEIG